MRLFCRIDLLKTKYIFTYTETSVSLTAHMFQKMKSGLKFVQIFKHMGLRITWNRWNYHSHPTNLHTQLIHPQHPVVLASPQNTPQKKYASPFRMTFWRFVLAGYVLYGNRDQLRGSPIFLFPFETVTDLIGGNLRKYLERCFQSLDLCWSGWVSLFDVISRLFPRWFSKSAIVWKMFWKI